MNFIWWNGSRMTALNGLSKITVSRSPIAKRSLFSKWVMAITTCIKRFASLIIIKYFSEPLQYRYDHVRVIVWWAHKGFVIAVFPFIICRNRFHHRPCINKHTMDEPCHSIKSHAIIVQWSIASVKWFFGQTENDVRLLAWFVRSFLLSFLFDTRLQLVEAAAKQKKWKRCVRKSVQERCSNPYSIIIFKIASTRFVEIVWRREKNNWQAHQQHLLSSARFPPIRDMLLVRSTRSFTKFSLSILLRFCDSFCLPFISSFPHSSTSACTMHTHKYTHSSTGALCTRRFPVAKQSITN